MQKAGLILSTAWPSIVYLRSVRYPQFDVNKVTHRKAEKKTGEMMSLSSAMSTVTSDSWGLTKQSAS